MIDWESCYIFQIPPEGMEALESGEGKLSTGGVRDAKGKPIKQAKPVELSIADIKSYLNTQEISCALMDHLRILEEKSCLSAESMKQIKENEWLNSIAIQRNYVATQEGFLQTINMLGSVSNQLGKLESYIKVRDKRALRVTIQKYINYLNSDGSKIGLASFDVTNSNVDSHLDEIAALLCELIDAVMNNTEDAFIAAQILYGLIQPFVFVVRKYSALFYIVNQQLPGDYYPQWYRIIKFVSEDKTLHNRLMYFINLHSNLMFKDRMALCSRNRGTLQHLLIATEFDRIYALTHSKEEYLKKEIQTKDQLVSGNYKTKGKSAFVILK